VYNPTFDFDYLVGTINNMYYDTTGGFMNFAPQDLYHRWKLMKKYSTEGAQGIRRDVASSTEQEGKKTPWQQFLTEHVCILGDDTILLRNSPMAMTASSVVSTTTTQTQYWEYTGNKVPSQVLSGNPDKAIQGFKWLVSTLGDPYSKYMTQQELYHEIHGDNNGSTKDGFLGVGMFIQPSSWSSTNYNKDPFSTYSFSYWMAMLLSRLSSTTTSSQLHPILSQHQAQYLPIVTAITPDSPAERAGIIVGDRVVAVGFDSFLGLSPGQVSTKIKSRYSASNYYGYPTLSIARPLKNTATSRSRSTTTSYRISKVRLPTKSVQDPSPYILVSNTIQGYTYNTRPMLAGGNNVVHYRLLTSQDSIFKQHDDEDDVKCGYIRLINFSRESTRGFLDAVQALETAHAQVYIIDLRNNYGGIFQEALLMASSLLYDPHDVLCYTLNSRGGFTPHDVEEYVVDTRYPGYLLSSESQFLLLENMKVTMEDWTSPSSYASFHEQRIKRGIHVGYSDSSNLDRHKRAQKKIVILVNEGTASSAEVFTAALRDNGRALAVIGSQTFGKGVIQHTFPMPNGDALKLTVAEYLTPKLQHVTKVGNARYDPYTGELVGGGIRPDVYCPSNLGIPSNIGADYCVGKALDVLVSAQAKDR